MLFATLWLHELIIRSSKWLSVIQFNSIQVYLCSAFHDTNRCKAALQKILSFYIIFRSRLLVVTMAEMYSKNHAVSYKLHVINQTVNTINCNDYVLWLSKSYHLGNWNEYFCTFIIVLCRNVYWQVDLIIKGKNINCTLVCTSHHTICIQKKIVCTVSVWLLLSKTKTQNIKNYFQ